jgi:hypothetical protein
MLSDVEKFDTIFESAKLYLLSFPEINKKILEEHINLHQNRQSTSIEKFFRDLLVSISTRHGMRTSIGDVDNLRELLFDYDPKLIAERYRDDWKKLFKDIEESDYEPPTQMNIDSPRSYWVTFIKGIISGANFLSSFENIEEFEKFAFRFYMNEYSRAALPMILEKEVYGLGFSSACDILKENGYPNYVKADTHIKEIFHGLGISKSRDDYEAFKDVIRFSRTIGEYPYVVDKLFWLIENGDFYLSGIKINTNREEFIERTLEKLDQ